MAQATFGVWMLRKWYHLGTGTAQVTDIATALRVVLTLAAMVGLAALGCGTAVEGRTDPPVGESGVLGGHTSQISIDEGEMSLEEIVERGRHLFTASFNTLDGAGRPETTDVSPNNFRPPHFFPDNFNRISGPDANACSSCHGVPRIGGGGDNATNVFVLADRLAFVNFDGREGDGLEAQTLKTVGNERTSLGLFGSGVIELLAREMTSDLHEVRDEARREAANSGSEVTRELSSKGIGFGRITARPDGTISMDELEGVDTDLIVRPFMQKGTIVSLREFAVKAMNQHFGMQASERFGDAVDHDADGMADEVSRGDITALVMFQATLPAPVRVESANRDARDAAARGEALFSSIGCAACHVPELPLESAVFSEPNPFNPSGKLQVNDVDSPYEVDLVSLERLTDFRRNEDGHIMVPVFTDLKRHDMGDVLNNEALKEEGVPTGEWLTRKLWGFASEPPFLHHGRATLMSEAILAHGGEAIESRESFASLATEDQAAVIEFLKTLQLPPEDADGLEEGSKLSFGSPVLWSAVGGGVAGAVIALVCVWAVIRRHERRA